jgi:SAM-dependent methyltransferase
LQALAPNPGENILDIGCGGGETALDLARAVAPDGKVVGVDLSAAVLAFAKRAANGCERVRFVHADAQVFPFEPASFDAAFSRFGVMFFTDPAAAFSNIRRSIKPNGRLAFVCWRALEKNPLDIRRSGPRLSICRHRPLATRRRPAHSRSQTRTECIGFWKERASRRSRSLPMTSWLEAAPSIRCWRFVRALELSAKFFVKIPSSGPQRCRQCDPRLRPTMDLMGSG